MLVFEAFVLASMASLLTDPANGLDSAGLDFEDQWRYVVTYCHLVKGESFWKQFGLATGCGQKVSFFGEKVCVVDPRDEDEYVPGTCLDLSKVSKVAETFCPKKSTTEGTTSTSEEDDYVDDTAVADPANPPELESGLEEVRSNELAPPNRGDREPR